MVLSQFVRFSLIKTRLFYFMFHTIAVYNRAIIAGYVSYFQKNTGITINEYKNSLKIIKSFDKHR